MRAETVPHYRNYQNKYNKLGDIKLLKNLIKNNNEIIQVYAVVLCIIFGLAIIISIRISKEITKPLEKLKNSMREVEKGDFENVNIVISGENEISSLSNSFKIMISEIKKLMEQNINEQKCASAIAAHFIRKAPDVRHADGRADRREDEPPAGRKALYILFLHQFPLDRKTCLFSCFHKVLLF